MCVSRRTTRVSCIALLHCNCVTFEDGEQSGQQPESEVSLRFLPAKLQVFLEDLKAWKSLLEPAAIPRHTINDLVHLKLTKLINAMQQFVCHYSW